MPNVTLINSTPNAVEMLIFTKSTRLQMSPALMEEIMSMTSPEKREILQVMARTIRSSWEFVDFTFLIEGVTRSIAQQITRTRQASYAMQSMRVTDASQMAIENPFDDKREGDTSNAPDCFFIFESAASFARQAYKDLITKGASKEDARDILPLGTTCNLVAKYNLRTFVDLVAQRENSLRAQGAYADIVGQMHNLVLTKYPEFEVFFTHPLEEAIKMLAAVAEDIGVTTGSGHGWEIAKAIDLLRKS